MVFVSDIWASISYFFGVSSFSLKLVAYYYDAYRRVIIEEYVASVGGLRTIGK